ncbi:MAG: hypothetical protein H6836_00925 [Planctomycetes bacterium]|nr:hypothetical protein [Planctomycetota bacterium]
MNTSRAIDILTTRVASTLGLGLCAGCAAYVPVASNVSIAHCELRRSPTPAQASTFLDSWKGAVHDAALSVASTCEHFTDVFSIGRKPPSRVRGEVTLHLRHRGEKLCVQYGLFLDGQVSLRLDRIERTGQGQKELSHRECELLVETLFAMAALAAFPQLDLADPDAYRKDLGARIELLTRNAPFDRDPWTRVRELAARRSK